MLPMKIDEKIVAHLDNSANNSSSASKAKAKVKGNPRAKLRNIENSFKEKDTKFFVKKSFMFLLVGASFALLGVLGFFAYNSRYENLENGNELPIIQGENKPFKIIPEEKGGMEIPHKDKLIYDEISELYSNQNKIIILKNQGEKTNSNPPEVSSELPIATFAAKKPSKPAKSADKPSNQDLIGNLIAKKVQNEDIVKTADTAHNSTSGGASANGAGGDATAGVLTGGTIQSQDIENLSKPLIFAKKHAKKHFGGHAKNNSVATGEADISKSGGNFQALEFGFYVQLGSYRNKDSLKNGLKILQNKHKDVIKSLNYSIKQVDIGSKGVFYRLYIGKLPSKLEATALCAEFRKRNQGCLVIKN